MMAPGDEPAAAESTPGPAVAIRVRNIEKRYGSQAVLSDVNFDVAEGELLVILGPSGSGKTTLLRILAGLEQPDSGSIELRGVDAGPLAPQQRNFGVVFQEQALFQRMTVERNISFGLDVRRKPKAEVRAKIDELLALIQLRGHRLKHPAQLSGGQRQRVALARALAFQPAAMLFDEPFSALDAVTRTELRREVRGLMHSVHMPAVFITHDQEEALELADRIAILNRGRIEQIGTPWEVYNRPANEFVATFLGASNVLLGSWRSGTVVILAIRLSPTGKSPALAEGQPVKVVFRPEDVVLSRDQAGLQGLHQLGQGRVDDVSYVGASERLSVRLALVPWRSDPASKVSPGVGYDGGQPITVTRTKWEAKEFPLSVEDEVEVGLKDLRLLTHYPIERERGKGVG